MHNKIRVNKRQFEVIPGKSGKYMSRLVRCIAVAGRVITNASIDAAHLKRVQ
jgi:hypothetical protein